MRYRPKLYLGASPAASPRKALTICGLNCRSQQTSLPAKATVATLLDFAPDTGTKLQTTPHILPNSSTTIMRRKFYPNRNDEFFYGKVYQLGHAAVSVRNTGPNANFTVLCMHGFLADHRYFTRLYRHQDMQLILMTASGYHVPVAQKNHEQPSWYQHIIEAPDSIEYDAEALIQALSHLPCTDQIRLHGHSRGGAVIIEASRRRPDLFAKLEVVLEAPLLPGTNPRWLVGLWANPLLLPVAIRFGPWLRHLPHKFYGSAVFNGISQRKRDLLASMLLSPKKFDTVFHNVRNLFTWVSRPSIGAWHGIQRGYLLLPANDTVLNRQQMAEQAAQLSPQLRLLETEAKTHFISLELPHCVPALRRRPKDSAGPNLQTPMSHAA